MTAAPSAPAPPPPTERPRRGKKPAPSGRLLLRMPAALHAELARTAEREGVSLNQFITRTLAGRVGGGGRGDAAGSARARGRGALVIAALPGTAIWSGRAAAAAIGVLVLAWRG